MKSCHCFAVEDPIAHGIDLWHPARWLTHDAFAAYRAMLTPLVALGDFPDVADYQRLLGAHITFAVQHQKQAAGIDRSDIEGSYAASCTRGQVPTRPGNLNDFLNACSWALFPRGKHALFSHWVRHARNRPRPLLQRLRDATQDRLAMLDEGGELRVKDASTRCVLGHALLQDAVRGRQSRALWIDCRGDCTLDDALVSSIDAHIREVGAEPRL